MPLYAPPQIPIIGIPPATAIAETLDRRVPVTNAGGLTSGRIHFSAIRLRAGQTVTSISWCSATTAAVAPTNQWFGLWTGAALPVKLAVTTDDLTTAWASDTWKTLALTAPYVVPTTGVYYMSLLVAAATPITTYGINMGQSVIAAVAPIVAGNGDSLITTPASANSPQGANTVTATNRYGYVS